MKLWQFCLSSFIAESEMKNVKPSSAWVESCVASSVNKLIRFRSILILCSRQFSVLAV